MLVCGQLDPSISHHSTHTTIADLLECHVTFYNEKFRCGRCDLIKKIQHSARGGGSTANQDQLRHVEKPMPNVEFGTQTERDQRNTTERIVDWSWIH